jgi:hypothetical protein
VLDDGGDHVVVQVRLQGRDKIKPGPGATHSN